MKRFCYVHKNLLDVFNKISHVDSFEDLNSDFEYDDDYCNGEVRVFFYGDLSLEFVNNRPYRLKFDFNDDICSFGKLSIPNISLDFKCFDEIINEINDCKLCYRIDHFDKFDHVLVVVVNEEYSLYYDPLRRCIDGIVFHLDEKIRKLRYTRVEPVGGY